MLVYQSTCTKSLETLLYGQITSIKFSNVVHSLKVKKVFHPKEDNKESLSQKYLYLNVIGALIYIANC